MLQGDEAVHLKLSAVKDRLMKADVRWLVFAGAAAYCYGSQREVTDIDILVRGVDLEKAKAFLKDIEGVDVVADLEIRTSQGTCRFFTDGQMIKRTRWKQLFGVKVPVIPVEDNIIFKAIQQRGEDQGKHDVEDIKHMIKSEKIDFEYLKNRIRKCKAERRVKLLLLSLIPSMRNRDVEKVVKNWFAKTADYEWKRLKQDPYHQLEFIVTMHFLEKHLPEKGLILDAGGGPGRYTIELAKKGYNMVLLDLVKETLEIAKRKIKEEKVQNKVKQIVEGTITDLSTFDNETFDGVLCLGGPLSHLLNIKQRETAVKELVRVVKTGAPLFISVIGRLGLLKTILAEFPDEIRDCQHHLEIGDYIPGVLPRKEVTGFTAAHWFMPEELQELFEGLNVETLDLVGLEGLSSHLEEVTNRLYKEKEKWNMWVDIILKTCNHPSIVGTTEHILYIGKRRSLTKTLSV